MAEKRTFVVFVFIERKTEREKKRIMNNIVVLERINGSVLGIGKYTMGICCERLVGGCV